MNVLSKLKAPARACAVALVAWGTATCTARALAPWVPPLLALAVAGVVGYGLVGALALPVPRSSSWRRVGSIRLCLGDILVVALLLPAFPLGMRLQAAIAHALGADVPAGAFEWSSDLVTDARTVPGVLAVVLVLVVLLPVLEEALFRGVVGAALTRSVGRSAALVLTSLLAALAFTSTRATIAEGLAVFVAASCWSLLLSAVRWRTGSLTAAIVLRMGTCAWWLASELARGTPMEAGRGDIARDVVLAACVASVSLGLFVLMRRAPLPAAGTADDTPSSQPSEVSDASTASRAPAPRRVRWPVVGVAVGVGLLVAECVVLVRGVLESFGGTGIATALLQTVAVYVVLGVAGDVAIQLALPRHIGGRALVRALPLAAVACAVEWRLGMMGAMAAATAVVALAWAAAWETAWSRPLAVAMAAVTFALALPDPARTRGAVALAPIDRGVSDASRRSLAVVVLDTVRRDHVSAYGYARKTTPNLDALAIRGVRFDRAYATSCWSIPSHASLFTGLLPRSHGATFEHMRLEPGPATLAEVLAAHGYDTAGFSANAYVTGATGMARGFGRFDDLWRSHLVRRAFAGMRLVAWLDGRPHDKGGAAVVSAVREWLASRSSDRPYFLFVNFMEAHAPYQDGALSRAFVDPALTASAVEAIGLESHEAQWTGAIVPPQHVPTTVDLLDGATASADDLLGEILAAVGEGVDVVVLSDHGDLLGEHGLFGHMTSLYEPLIRIPLVAAGPDVQAGVVDAPVSIMDVMPTLLSLVGVPSPRTDGFDLSAALRDGAPLPMDRPLLAEHDRNAELSYWVTNRSQAEIARLRARKVAVILAGKKRIAAEDGADDGFDLELDPGENHPLPGPDTGLVLPPHPGTRPARGPVKLGPAELEALRALGYVR